MTEERLHTLVCLELDKEKQIYESEFSQKVGGLILLHQLHNIKKLSNSNCIDNHISILIYTCYFYIIPWLHLLHEVMFNFQTRSKKIQNRYATDRVIIYA